MHVAVAASDDDQYTTQGRFYTSARKFKQRLGALPDGTKIWGGPYTYSQVTVMVLVLLFGWLTRGLWGGSNALFDLIGLVALAWGTGWLIGKAPQGKRSMLSLVTCAFVLLRHPGPGGHYKGQSIRLKSNAVKIQRKLKQQQKRDKQKLDIESEKEPIVHPMAAGYGSSLNRLLDQSAA